MSWVIALAGLGSGLVVGVGAASVARALGLIVRLTAFAGKRALTPLTWIAALGMIAFTCAYEFGWFVRTNEVILALAGGCAGVFVGMLACALAELFDTLPILGKRLTAWVKLVLFAMAIGKICFALWDLVAV